MKDEFGFEVQDGQTRGNGYKGAAHITGSEGSGGGWITALRVILWLVFVASLVLGCYMLAGGIEEEEVFFIVLGIASPIIGLLSIAGGMVALDAAENVKRCATNSARIIELLQQRK